MGEEKDIIQLLLDDHEQVRGLFSRIERSSGKKRAELFAELREELVRHEVAEEEILRPLSRKHVGKAVAEARIHEEAEAEETLKEMEKLEVDANDFALAFKELHTSVEQHARNEEELEFPELRQKVESKILHAMGQAYLMAKKAAPTHPHPSTPNTTAANLLVGPFAATADRARDAVRKAMDAVRS